MDEIFGIDREYERTLMDGPPDPSRRPLAMLAYFKDEVLGQGKPFEKEYRIVRQSDGAVRWVHGLGRLELDAEGRPVKMHGTIKTLPSASRRRLRCARARNCCNCSSTTRLRPWPCSTARCATWP